MTRNPTLALLAGLGSLFPLDAARAEIGDPVVLGVVDPDPNDRALVNDEGRLQYDDGDHTNEQAVFKTFGGPFAYARLGDRARGLYVHMRTGALPTGERPEHRVQAACTPVELVQRVDGRVELEKRAGERFITANDGNEWRNAHKPELMPVCGGKAMLVMFNYQPNGTNDTRRYAKLLGPSCEAIPVENAAGEPREQVQIMAKANDDCDMHQSGEGPCDVATDSATGTHLVCWAGCNGNGADDGWANDIAVDCRLDAAGAVTQATIRKNFDISLAQREERSRGRCSVADADPDTAICTWTEGNTQPQRDGTWIAAIDISPGGEQGAAAQSRLLWKEQIDGQHQLESGATTYSVRAMHARVLERGADGVLVRSPLIFFRSGDLEGNNDDGRKGGTYRKFKLAVLRATREGLADVVPLHDATGMLLGLDGTHLTMCSTVFGDGGALRPGFTLLQGSHNGGGVQEPVVKAIALDEAAGTLVDLGMHRVGGSYDRHLYSQYLGNNPGNQGRNFAGCALLANPFAGRNGSTAEFFVGHALTGKDPAWVNDASMKPTAYLSLLPVATLAPEPTPDPDEPGDPGTPAPDPGAGSPGGETGEPGGAGAQPSLLGCAAASGSRAAAATWWLLLLLALGTLIALRRGRLS